ncbi:MAG: YceH family protein [Pseudomonadota bacterium]|nr:YceH family protein [Pseudomonadota bacterium]
MLPNLTVNETRMIGCLMEKSIYTPDQYPLTLNALTNACNQKSGRNPVMSLNKGVVQHTVRDLRDKHLVHIEENFKSGVEKYKQRFCNTRFGDYQFDPPQFAIVCLLLLRGPQTPGEIRARSERLHAFADNTSVVDALNSLLERSDPLIVKLPRTPGRKDSEYMHLFSGPIDVEAHAMKAKAATTAERASKSDLEQRVARLEAEIVEIRALINT